MEQTPDPYRRAVMAIADLLFALAEAREATDKAQADELAGYGERLVEAVR